MGITLRARGLSAELVGRNNYSDLVKDLRLPVSPCDRLKRIDIRLPRGRVAAEQVESPSGHHAAEQDKWSSKEDAER